MNLKHYLEKIQGADAESFYYNHIPKNFQDIIKEEEFPEFYAKLEKEPQIADNDFRLYFNDTNKTKLIGFVIVKENDSEDLDIVPRHLRLMHIFISNKFIGSSINYEDELREEFLKANKDKFITSHAARPDRIDTLRHYKFQPYGKTSDWKDTILVKEPEY